MTLIENFISQLLLKGYTARQIDELNNFIDKVETKIKEKDLNKNEDGDIFLVGLVFMYDLFYEEHKNSLFLLKDEDIKDVVRTYKDLALKHFEHKFDDDNFENLIQALQEVLNTRKSLQK